MVVSTDSALLAIIIDLMEYLDRLEKDPQRAQTFRRTELCQTIAQNSCDMLTITSSGKQVIAQEDRQSA